LHGGFEDWIGQVKLFGEILIHIDPDFLSFFGHSSRERRARIGARRAKTGATHR
jgi:hypothetical protein